MVEDGRVCPIWCVSDRVYHYKHMHENEFICENIYAAGTLTTVKRSLHH